MTLRSSLYVGSVMHRRLRPRVHRFRYRAFWFLLDLDELDELSNKLRWFSYNRSNIFSFYDADHGDGTATPIRTQIERQLAEAQVDLAGGRIQLLCMPRALGYCFNPISIYFCYRADASLAAVVYQVHNTFGERHSYVIRVEGRNAALYQCSQKLFYVSPFLDMDMRYDFRITGPDERIAVGICASSCQEPVLNAVLAGLRGDLTDRNLMSVFLKIPAITIKVIAAIHWEALRLWAKGIGLRQRPLPPKRPATIVTASSVTAD
ncbi:MAG: DUF1365 domain-containing protein [Alphaproteobacteria bacterium]|nr:DUF1365 domain-containing protein [Alphaproteobacteria bacterium]